MMELSLKDFYSYILKYRSVVDEISDMYHYPSNISHLLYLIVPVMVAKYGLRYEREIISLFRRTPIIILDEENLSNPASFSRKLVKDEEKIEILRSVQLKHYQAIGVVDLLDNLIHEFNHAANSVKNESYQDGEFYYLRTGLAFLKCRLDTMENVDEEGILLEEIINTRQTEEMIDYLISFSKVEVEDREIANTLYAIRSMGSTYTSRAYYLQSVVCKPLLHNSTFIRTLENLRFQGEIRDIENWFDTITGKVDSYSNLLSLLKRSMELERELGKTKFFVGLKKNKLRSYISEIQNIVNLFNQNCNFR